MKMLRRLILFGYVMLSLEALTSAECSSECELPDCYCDQENIPGGYSSTNTPQMILFTYTGAVTKSIREAIVDIFPDSLKNPNKCPIGITSFVVSQGSDDCSIYRMYYRGHEIALAGANRTGWNDIDWKRHIAVQHEMLSMSSNIDMNEITGMRAQKLKPGGDDHFDVLRDDGLFYDSSLLAGPTNVHDDDHLYSWPFTLDQKLTDDECRNPPCPTKSYKGTWEIPVSSLLGTRMGKPRACSYIDDCLSDLKSAADVSALLRKNFLHSYKKNRAPFQVNLQPRSLETKIVVKGLKDFIEYAMRTPDVWIVTNQEALKWIQNPIPNTNIIESGVWDCPSRGEYVKCRQKDEAPANIPRVTMRVIMNVDHIWPWQTAALIVLYFVVYRYDRFGNSKA